MPTYRTMGLPKLTGIAETDIKNLRDAFYQQDEQLRYMFLHLEMDNLAEGLSSSISGNTLRLETDEQVEFDTAGIISQVMDELKGEFTRIEQSVNDISLTVVDSEGKETSVNLSSGKFDISFLETGIDDAEKVATNFISVTDDGGIEVGNKSDGDWTGYRTQMLADRFCIVDADGNELASYEANKIDLGKNDLDTVISFCNGKASISFDSDNSWIDFQADDLTISTAGNGDTSARVTVFKEGDFGSGITLRAENGTVSDSDWFYSGLDIETGYVGITGNDFIGLYAPQIDITGKIRGQVTGSSWYQGRDKALIAVTNNDSADHYYPLTSMKTINGDWSIGTLGDGLYFVYFDNDEYSGTSPTYKNRIYFDGTANMKLYGSDPVDHYYNASSSYTGTTYNIAFGIGGGGVNRGIWDTNRKHWTLCNTANDTLFRSTGTFCFYADTDASTAPKAVVIGNSGSGHPLLRPYTDAYGYLGGTDFRWHSLITYNVDTKYAVNVSSDRRWKKDISYDLSALDGIFDLLDPAVYRMKDDENGSLRFGFIAQDMAGALEKLGLNPDDYALLRKDENGYYSIGYTETNALLWNEVKKLKARITELEKGIA